MINFNKKNASENNIYLKYHFYDTRNFEVFCFCPLILNIKKDKKILTNEMIKNYTDYFLVGGFDLDKNKGIIKLYKVNYSKIYYNTNIEFIEDFKFKDKDFKKFRGPISYITQTKHDGKLLINCWDGHVYLFDKPEINQYLEYEKELSEKLNIR